MRVSPVFLIRVIRGIRGRSVEPVEWSGATWQAQGEGRELQPVGPEGSIASWVSAASGSGVQRGDRYPASVGP
jgi:hypothetical protein